METVSRKKWGIYGVEQKRLENWKKKGFDFAKLLLIEKAWLLALVGFLLGRAVVLTTVSPFAVAFLASIWLTRRKKMVQITLATVAGASTYHWTHGLYIAGAAFVLYFLALLCKRIPHQIRVMAVLVFLASSLPRMLALSYESTLSSFDWMMIGVEGILGSVLFIIFMQSIPLLSIKRYYPALKNEEIVCLIILLASVLTGTIGWQIQGAGIEQIFSRYFVLLLALIGGAAMGSTVGVVAGLILSLANVASLYEMSLLAFAGLLGGLLKDGKKFGVSIGLVIGTLLIGVYGQEQGMQEVYPSLLASAISILLLVLTPDSWIRRMSRFVPGTAEHNQEQEQYLQKVRDVTANRVQQFSNVFDALAKSFATPDRAAEDVRNRETDFLLGNVTEQTCQLCFKKDRCWGAQQFDRTYQLMESLKEDMEDGGPPNKLLERNLESHCVKSKKVIETMKHELSFHQANQMLRRQVQESRRFVADQLNGVSEVMGDFAKEIVKEKENHEHQEVEMMAALRAAGLVVDKLDVFSLTKGSIDIEMHVSIQGYHGEGQKLIGPILSDILGETVVVTKEEIAPFPDKSCFLAFSSIKKFVVDTGVAHAAKGGGFVSGDSFSTIELGAGKYAIAISDGMGNGDRAHEESTETLRLLQQILQSGIREEVAIKSINSILSLRSNEEIFATLDLAVIDLHDAAVQFLKIGSTPSFIKRGDQVLKIESGNLPIGIVQDLEVDVVQEQLQPGDLLVMMSDGIFEAPRHVENTDVWLKRKIKEMNTTVPQEMADLLLEEVVRHRAGEIEDDMTVMVAAIDRNIPEWASIPTYKNKVKEA
ncbi:stage II sporulation protein E [Terribacillus saccharophilus]|uniref:stage II sporulation protein E n=1 Tax=Terribacillus saccharophilus TaxID=361277 RepID=UPI002DCA3687|nr:stage II sporulation protein E [Terribacillus saccharophilus]MEC0292316.1 stage II sporulation protein E [Terribacillus saccharophilus]